MFANGESEFSSDYLSLPKESYHLGFKLVHNDSYITVFGDDDKKNSSGVRASKIGYWKKLLWKLRTTFRCLIGIISMRINSNTSYEPGEYTSASNPLSKLILLGRDSQEGDRIVGIEQVNSYYTDLLGSENHRNKDEEFLELIKRKL